MDKFELLRQYKELLDMGVITQAEFDAKKKELIEPDAGKKDEKQAPVKEEEPTDAEKNEKQASVKEEKPIDAESVDEKYGVPYIDEVSDDASEVSEAAGTPEEPDEQAQEVPEAAGTPEEPDEPIREVPEQAVAAVPEKKRKGRLPKPAIIGIVCVIIALIAGGVFLMSDIGRIQGSWKAAYITTGGKTTPVAGTVGGSLKVTGNKWTMELRTPEIKTFSGKIISSTKTATNEGVTVYFYDFENDSGGTLRAGYVPKEKAVMVCASSSFDADNSMVFKK